METAYGTQAAPSRVGQIGCVFRTADTRCSDNYASDEAQSPRSGAAERRPPEHITYWNSWKQGLE
jgi:hypothetical protein